MKRTSSKVFLCVAVLSPKIYRTSYVNMSHITCHMSPVTKANSHSHTPSIPPPLCTVGWFTQAEPKNPKSYKPKIVSNPYKKKFLSFTILAIRSSTRSLQLSLFRSPTEGQPIHSSTHGHCNL